MPLHLPPVSRRRFLATGLGACAGALAWRDLLGAEREADADRWALLADTHVAADRGRVNRGVNMADHLARVVKEVAELKPRPAGVLLDGDAAYLRGEAGDYRTLGELLKPLSAADLPVHFTLGNHDQRDNFRAGLLRGAARSALASHQVSVVECKRVNWFLLDSLVKTNSTPGELGKEQLDWLAGALDARATRPALVVVHHDPQWTAPAKRRGLVDTEWLFEVLAGRKQVKALLFGHTHRWRRERRDGIHLVNLPAVSYVFDKDQPSGWVDLRLGDGGAALTLHALGGHRQDGERVELTWR
jgi:3',5'-cyclic AMP phosphodiesterase CpdA